MTRLTKLCDNIIRGVKREVEDVRFVRAYRFAQSEYPVRGFIGVVDAETVADENRYLNGCYSEGLSGTALKADMKITLYCPKTSSGSELCSKALEIIRAVTKCGGDYVLGTKLYEVKYNENEAAIYRIIRVRLGCVVCEEEQ